MPVIQSLTRGDSVAFSGLREERCCAAPGGKVPNASLFPASYPQLLDGSLAAVGGVQFFDPSGARQAAHCRSA
jgi:hypothetical protein